MKGGDVDTVADLTSRLKALYERVCPPVRERRAVIPDLVDELVRLYSQPHRHYHNLLHVQECLREFDEVSSTCKDPAAVEMAIWYHDIIYEPTADSNERLSANKASFDCLRLGILHRSFVERVVEFILATGPGGSVKAEAAMVVDADLAILGASMEKFAEYEGQIRKEYAHVPEKDYVAGRTLILDGFMRRPTIFSTEHFKTKYERTAHANIARSLMSLAIGGRNA